MADSHRFAVLGAGSWGSALALVLAHQNHDVHLWTRDDAQRNVMVETGANPQYLPGVNFPDNITISPTLEAAIVDSDHVLVAVPSHAFASVLAQVHHIWPEEAGVIWATKGIDPESGDFLSSIADTILGKETPKAILTGPSFAKEVAHHQPTAVTIASNNAQFAKTMQFCFNNPHFRVYLNDDMIGAQLGGSVKNVLAVAVGLADGLGYGMNTKAGLMTRGLAEMIRLGEVLGAKRDTLIGLSGLGDLILTCSDNQSRNRRFGIAVGKGQSFEQACQEIGQVVEGIKTTETVYQLAQQHQVEMPITTQMYRILYQGLDPKVAVDELLCRSSKAE